jgi:mannosyltransferase
MPERTSVDTPPHGWPLVTVAVVSSVLGVVLRLMPRSALWLDEALSVNIASLPLGDIPSALERDGHPPLYYFLLHFWLELGSSDWWVRTLSAIVSVLGGSPPGASAHGGWG